MQWQNAIHKQHALALTMLCIVYGATNSQRWFDVSNTWRISKIPSFSEIEWDDDWAKFVLKTIHSMDSIHISIASDWKAGNFSIIREKPKPFTFIIWLFQTWWSVKAQLLTLKKLLHGESSVPSKLNSVKSHFDNTHKYVYRPGLRSTTAFFSVVGLCFFFFSHTFSHLMILAPFRSWYTSLSHEVALLQSSYAFTLVYSLSHSLILPPSHSLSSKIQLGYWAWTWIINYVHN